MARSIDAPYPSPSPALYDEQLPRLQEKDVRDGYDKQFRINQRLRRWGIEIADILNNLDFGDWDPSTRVLFIGDGDDADYENIGEATINISPSSFDPRILIVFPGTYFHRLYIPAHTAVYGIGERGSVKIHVECENGETVIEGGSKNIHFYNIDISQTNAGATGTKTCVFTGGGISFTHCRIGNAATDKDSEVLVIDSGTVADRVRLEDVYIRGYNSDVNGGTANPQRQTVHADTQDLWLTNTAPGAGCPNSVSGRPAMSVTETETVVDGSPFSDDCERTKGANYAFICVSGLDVNPSTVKANALGAWLKIYSDAATADQGVMAVWETQTAGSEDGWFVTTGGNGSLRLRHFRSGVVKTDLQTDNAVIQANRWHLVEVSVSATTGWRIYVDGELEGWADASYVTVDQIWAGSTVINIWVDFGDIFNDSTGVIGKLGVSDIIHFYRETATIRYREGGALVKCATLRVNTDAGGTAPSWLEMHGVTVHNNKPDFNVWLGSQPTKIEGLTSIVDTDAANTWNVHIDNDISTDSPFIIGPPTIIGGKYSLVLTGLDPGVRMGFGGTVDKPMDFSDPVLRNKRALQHYYAPPSPVSDLTVFEVFRGEDFNAGNLLYNESIDAGHLMPDATTKHFPNVEINGLGRAEDFLAQRGDVFRQVPGVGDMRADLVGEMDADFIMPEPSVKHSDSRVELNGRNSDGGWVYKDENGTMLHGMIPKEGWS